MDKGQRVLITGGAGFVGSALVRAFLASGYGVRALARSTSPRDNFAGLEIECVEGDIRDAASVERAMKGVRYLVHAAADYRLWTRDPAALVRTNVEGTRMVMRAALAEGVERIVYTSSVATLAPRAEGDPADQFFNQVPGGIGLPAPPIGLHRTHEILLGPRELLLRESVALHPLQFQEKALQRVRSARVRGRARDREKFKPLHKGALEGLPLLKRRVWPPGDFVQAVGKHEAGEILNQFAAVRTDGGGVAGRHLPNLLLSGAG